MPRDWLETSTDLYQYNEMVSVSFETSIHLVNKWIFNNIFLFRAVISRAWKNQSY
jgi:hypothetical protein